MKKILSGFTCVAVASLSLCALAGTQTLSASSYVQDGLVLCYDGIENAGAGVHESSRTSWRNLGSAGADYDLSLPSRIAVAADGKSFISGQGNGESSLQFSSVSGIDITKPFTVEVVSRLVGWKDAVNYLQLQTIAMTPRGAIGYRQNNVHGFYVGWPTGSSTVKAQNWEHSTALAADIHTMTIHQQTQENNPLMDGVSCPFASLWGDDIGTVSVFKFMQNARTETQVYSIRVYNRVLTDAEIARNVAVDAVRFHGKQAEFVATDIPDQVRRYLGTVTPKPTVSDAITGATLTEGDDYTLSYSGNDQFGTASVKIVGAGAYEGFSESKSFSVVSEVSAEIRSADSGTLLADVGVLAADEARKVYVAYGTSDGGDSLKGWTSVAEVGEIAAGETSATGLALPSAVGAEATYVRFFVAPPSADAESESAANYAQDGLVLQFDGVENAGAGQHAGTPTSWKNLGTAGADYDLSLPGWVSAAADGDSFVSTYNGGAAKTGCPTFSSVTGIDDSEPYTIEVVSKCLAWRASNYASLQYAFATPRGALGYRGKWNGSAAVYDEHGFFYSSRNSDGTCSARYWHHGTAKESDIHTLAAQTHVSDLYPYLDGTKATNESVTGGDNVGNVPYKFFSNACSDIQVYAMRVYNRELTEDEIAKNALVDDVRFRHAPVPSVPMRCRRPLTAKVRHSSGVGVADLSFAASEYARNAYVVWGSVDGGETIDGWEHVSYIGRIAAGAVSANGLTLPVAAANAKCGRFFLDVGTGSLAQDGLVLCYDGIENAGTGTHAETASVWKNLGSGGSDYDLTLPSWVTASGSNSFVSAYGTSKSGYPTFDSIEGIDAGKPYTVEIVMRNRGWKLTDNYAQIQSVFIAPRGYFGYRDVWAANPVAANGFFYSCKSSSGPLNMYYWWHPTAKMADVHTLSACLENDANAPSMDGVAGSATSSGTLDAPTAYKFFTNARTDIQIYSIRLYDRALTSDEVSQNAAVDAMRFKGTPSDAFDCSSAMDMRGRGLVVIVR